MKRLFALLTIAILFTGCSIMGKKDKPIDPLEPVKLAKEIVQTYDIEKLWSSSTGSGIGTLNELLEPALDGNRIFAASRNGDVSAFDVQSGKRIWANDLDVTVTGGVSASKGLVLLGTRDGEVFAINQEDGRVRWQVRVSSEVLSAPATNGKEVVLATIDGKVIGLNADSGKQLWVMDVIRPPLSLRGNGSPVVTQDVAYVGHDNGKMVAYRTIDGAKLWETRVGIPTGRTELERLVDIDGAPLLYAGVLYAVSFQGGLMAINPENGRGFWYQEASSHNNIGAYGGSITITEVDATIRTFNVADGTLIWENRELKNRGLSAPVAGSKFVAVGDFEGYVHVFERQTGELLARRKIDGSGIRAPMIIREDVVYILDNGGGLSAYRVQPIQK